MNSAGYIAESIKQANVPAFFYPGADLLEMDCALDAAGVQKIVMANDASVVHACNGFFQATGKTGIGFVSSGPGTSNCLTALATAAADQIPVLLVATTISRSQIGQGGFQDFDMMSAIRGILNRAYFCFDGERLGQYFSFLFQNLFWNGGEPALITAPPEAFCEKTALPALSLPAHVSFKKKMVAGERIISGSANAAIAECQGLFDIFVVGNGMNKYLVLESLPGVPFVSNDRFGAMGFGLSAAIGAAIGLKCPVTLFIGDGDFIMSMAELTTVMRYNIPIKIVIVNNTDFQGGLGVAKRKKGFEPLPLKNPDFARIANSFGMAYQLVNGFDLREKLSKALAKTGPSIIEFPCKYTVEPSQIKRVRCQITPVTPEKDIIMVRD